MKGTELEVMTRHEVAGSAASRRLGRFAQASRRFPYARSLRGPGVPYIAPISPLYRPPLYHPPLYRP